MLFVVGVCCFCVLVYGRKVVDCYVVMVVRISCGSGMGICNCLCDC